jgi:hypothetical protein
MRKILAVWVKILSVLWKVFMNLTSKENNDRVKREK